MRGRVFFLCSTVLTLSACGGGGGSTASAPAYFDPVSYATGPNDHLSSAKELSVSTQHQLALNGTTIHYTATTGHLTAANPTTAQAEASFFYTAYTANGTTASTRPLMFLFNGGPGSATMYLHMGSFGPKRLVTNIPSTNIPLPYQLVDNQESLIDVADMVYVDAVGTGLSEAIAPNTNQTFWGYGADASVMNDFILRYLQANHREDSPLYVFGESYGTFRAALVGNQLATEGMNLKGVILQSSVTGGASDELFYTEAGAEFTSYALIGAAHNLLNPNPTDIQTFKQQVEGIGLNTVGPALADALVNSPTIPLSPDIVNQLVDLTGAPAATWQTGQDVYPDQFFAALLPGQATSWYDGRISVPNSSPLAQNGDPFLNLVDPVFLNAIRAQLTDFLHYTSPTAYQPQFDNPNNIWSDDGWPVDGSLGEIATAMAQDSDLKILNLGGYYDVATPYFLVERGLEGLGYPDRVQVHTYVGGHMTYLDDASRVSEKADLIALINSTTAH